MKRVFEKCYDDGRDYVRTIMIINFGFNIILLNFEILY